MSDPPRRWFRFRLRTLLLLALLAAVGLSLYSYWSEYADLATRRERELLSPARGAYCTIELRRELLGEDAARSIGGPFVLMNDQWIVLGGQREGEPQQWIPREHVLLLRVDVR